MIPWSAIRARKVRLAMEAEMQEAFIANPQTGVIHKLVIEEGRRRPLEECNTDQLVEEVVMSRSDVEQAIQAGLYRACGHCLSSLSVESFTS